MKFGNYILANAKWHIHKNCFESLRTITTTYDQLIEQIKNIGNKYFPERAKIKTINTEFCLNKIALAKPKTDEQRVVMMLFDGFWQDYLKIKSTFEREYLTFPASGFTRIEQVAILIAKCTGFCLNDNQLAKILERCNDILDLTDSEKQYLPQVVNLYKINYYTALASNIFSNKKHSMEMLAKMINKDILREDFEPNTHYKQASYSTKQLTTVVDCLGQSVCCFDGVAHNVAQKLFVYKNRRNLFDTFVQSKLGQNTSQFRSQTKQITVQKQYFLHDNCEICKILLTNKSDKKSKFTIQLSNYSSNEYFCTNGGLGIVTTNGYVGQFFLQNNKVTNCQVYQNSMSFDVVVLPRATINFDIVTVWGKSVGDIANSVERITHFGGTNCPHLTDKLINASAGRKLNLTPCSYALSTPPTLATQKLNFTYRLGNDDVATFVDNAGNSATLLQGFIFGTTGEKIYSVQMGNVKQINCGRFTVDGQLVFENGKSTCTITHNQNKHTTVQHSTPQKTLVYLPFERVSKVKKVENTFVIHDGKRAYAVQCNGKIESYTTDNIECNSQRLRYKLSNNITCGECLAICFAKDTIVTFAIVNAQKTPQATPLVQESLVSTYLNYVNDKNVFCLANKLKRPTALMVAGIVYTNPQYVKNYLEKLFANKIKLEFYDYQGRLQGCNDSLLLDLATIYYMSLTGQALDKKLVSYVNDHLLSKRFEGFDLAVQCLALKKASQLVGFDKVKCLVEYSNVKKLLTTNSKLYAYAQAIGALPLINPSKERLKDLCNTYDIPKNWYYVSQLENLYGLSLCNSSLNITPKVTAENVLEQFALNFDGKRINTTFSKGTTQSMVLNGLVCYQPFDPYSLTESVNTLVVRY